MMMRLLACFALVTPLVAKRVAVKKATLAGVTAKDLEDSWLSITVSRSGSFFAQGDEVLEVKDGKVSGEGEEEPFGTLVMKKDTLHLETGVGLEDIWAVTGSETDEEQCTKWNDYLELVETLKNKPPPPGMFSLAQTNSTKEEGEIVCVDWAHVGSTTSPTISGMYSLAETEMTGGRTMHWLRKQGVSLEDALMELTAELVQLSPATSSGSLEARVKWASKAIKTLLNKPVDQVVSTVISMIDTSQFELGMSEELKGNIAQKIVEILVQLKEHIPPTVTQEAPF